MKGPVQKIVFCSISTLSYYSELMYYTVNYFDDLEWTGYFMVIFKTTKKSRIWGIILVKYNTITSNNSIYYPTIDYTNNTYSDLVGVTGWIDNNTQIREGSIPQNNEVFNI
jgi:hypothetical protein